MLAEKGSLTLQRPVLFHFIEDKEEFHQRKILDVSPEVLYYIISENNLSLGVHDIFSWIQTGQVGLFPLRSGGGEENINSP